MDEAMQILELGDGQVSLELAPTDLAEALEALRRFGSVRREEKATYDVLHLPDAQIILENEWDAPCLLSVNKRGAAILRSLADDFRGSGLRIAAG